MLLMPHVTHSVISGPKSTTKSSWKSCKTLWEIVACLEHIDYRTGINNNLLITRSFKKLKMLKAHLNLWVQDAAHY